MGGYNIIDFMWVVIGTLLYNLILSSCFYFSAHSENSSVFDKDEAIYIKHFNKICWFKDKQKGVLAYCYITQVYSVLQFLLLLVISVGFIIYTLISNNIIDLTIVLLTGFCYFMVNCAIMITWSFVVYIKYRRISKKIKRQKEERRLKREQKRQEKLKLNMEPQ